jgi:hypothetical protein
MRRGVGNWWQSAWVVAARQRIRQGVQDGFISKRRVTAEAGLPSTRVLDFGLLPTALVISVLTANVALVAITIYGFFVSPVGHDWGVYVEAGRRVVSGGLYHWEGAYAWSYSPLLAYAFAALAPIGYVGWSLLHAAALATLRDRSLALLTVVSWPFWVDLYNGNTMVFVFVAAAAAVRRSVVGSAAYLVLTLLMPRPLMLPVLAWILWQQPQWRTRFVVMTLVYVAILLLSGQLIAWLHALTSVSDAVALSSRDIGPSILLGGWWLWLGGILAVALTIRGRIGLASLAASPYWLPQYLMMGLLELQPRPAAADERADDTAIAREASPG